MLYSACPSEAMARSTSFIYTLCCLDGSHPKHQKSKDATISSIIHQSISSSKKGNSMGGGKDVEGECAVGAMVGKGVIGNGGTGSRRSRDCRLESADKGMYNESVGRVCRGMGGRGRSSCDFRRCDRRTCDLRFKSVSLVLKRMESSYSSRKRRKDECGERNDVLDNDRDKSPN